jgi:hypothetical protein
MMLGLMAMLMRMTMLLSDQGIENAGIRGHGRDTL